MGKDSCVLKIQHKYSNVLIRASMLLDMSIIGGIQVDILSLLIVKLSLA